MAYIIPPSAKIPDSRHAAVGAWFLGPRSENHAYLEGVFKYILAEQKHMRETLYPNDKPAITREMQESKLYQDQICILETDLVAINRELGLHSVPFWSPRYNAHMLMETTMPSVIGYLTGLLHNQNNVANEASPLTTILETDVGLELSNMLGFDISPTSRVRGWGHITCDGSVANLESIWAARNLKFYPFSLSLAITEGPLKFLQEEGYEVELCTGQRKKFMDCDAWELLNLKPSTVLNIPDDLYNLFGISQTALGNAMQPYLIQSTGKDYLEKKFGIEPAHYLVGTTKHYSWPKGAAITGIGSKHMLDIPVDFQARIDPKELEKMLEKAVEHKKHAIFAVVAIMGSTEHGAVDPLTDVLALREKFEKKGLSFVVHCDAAWGGYFASMIRDRPAGDSPKGESSYVPTLALSPYTEKQLAAYKDADSITIDPHKSGYCPYPAGGLCYRDGRMRFLVTWTSPIVYHVSESEPNESIGVYGVEGSKPGAAAVGAYLSNRVLGLHKEGYGTLLGEAVFSCSRLYCHWAAMETQPIPVSHGSKARLIIRPFTLLPIEKKGGSPEQIEKERQFIRDRILNKENAELEADPEAVRLLKEVGGDLQINAFACNFELDGKLNEDVIEANYLNQRIFEALSVSDDKKSISDVPLFLTSTTMEQSAYKGCLDIFKKRLGLKGDQDLYVLVNVTMSPWPTVGNFIGQLADDFLKVANAQLNDTTYRDVEYPDYHSFVLQGTEQLCAVYVSAFYEENHRTQLVIECDLPADVLEKYRQQKKKDPKQFMTISNTKPMTVEGILKEATFDARLDVGLPDEKKQPLVDKVQVSKVRVLLQRSLHTRNIKAAYPSKMVFYTYSRGSARHIEHVLSTATNIQLSSEQVKLSSLPDGKNAEGLWLRLTQVNDSAIQPLTMPADADHTSFEHPGLQFVAGGKFAYDAYASEDEALNPKSAPIASGEMSLGPAVFAQTSILNADPGNRPFRTQPVPYAIFHDTSLARASPTPGACKEVRDRHHRRIMQGYRKSWNESRKAAAREIEERRGSGGPPWLEVQVGRKRS